MKQLIIIGLLLIQIAVFSQQVTLKGTVSSSEDGFPVSYASIKDTLSGKGTYTDEEGVYSIKLDPGTYVFQVKTLGYKTATKTINLTGNQTLNFVLLPDVLELEEVVIEQNEVEESINSVETSTEELTTEEIKKIPAFLGEPDVIKAIQLLPGVTSVGEGASGFNVRGGNIDQNLILSDNASIYSSSHLFGFFSVFNPDAVKDLKLYKGGIPSKFGERVSSVLDVHQRSGSKEKFHVDGGVGIVSSRLTIGGPLKKGKASFLVSGRRTYVDLFFNLSRNPDTRNTVAFFQDLNAKLDWDINENNSISFTAVSYTHLTLPTTSRV